MIVQIKVRGDDGKYRSSMPGEFAEAAIRQISNFDSHVAFHSKNVWQENRITRSDSCVLDSEYQRGTGR